MYSPYSFTCMYSAAEQKSEGGKEAQDSFHVPRSIQMICGTSGSDEDPHSSKRLREACATARDRARHRATLLFQLEKVRQSS